MGSRSRSDNRTSSSSNVEQDIFGQTTGDVLGSIVAAGDVDSRTDESLDFDARDQSDRSVRTGDLTTSTTTNIERADTDVLMRSIAADEAQSEILAAGFSIFADNIDNANSRGADLAREVSGQAFSLANEQARRTGEALESGLGSVTDALEDFGGLTSDVLDQQGRATAQVLAANRTETAQGFESLQETLITVAGIGAAAFVLTRF